MKRFLLLVIGSFLLASCSVEISDSHLVTQDTIYRYHTVRYNAQTETLTLRSHFRVNGVGASVRLSSPSRVYADGTRMELVETDREAYYQLERNVAAPDSHYRFEWHKDNGTIVIDRVPMAKPINIQSPTNAARVRRGEEFEVRWQGEPKGTDENIHLQVRYTEDIGRTPMQQDWRGAYLGRSVRVDEDTTRSLAAPGFLQIQISRIQMHSGTSCSSESETRCLYGMSIYESEHVNLSLTR